MKTLATAKKSIVCTHPKIPFESCIQMIHNEPEISLQMASEYRIGYSYKMVQIGLVFKWLAIIYVLWSEYQFGIQKFSHFIAI